MSGGSSGAKARRVRVPHEERLVWFFQHADADMGIGSNLGPMVSAALGGWGGSSSPENRMTDERLRAAGRARVLRAKLLHLEPRQRAVLAAVYGHQQSVPVQVRRHLGMLAVLALATKAARAAYDKATAKLDERKRPRPDAWLTAACSGGRDGQIEAIEREAAEMLDEALVAWWAL